MPPPPAQPPYAQPPPPYAPPPYAPPRGIQRGGWFVGFDIGAGSLTVTDDSIASDGYGGARFGAHFGGMINPRFGLMLALDGGVYTVDPDRNLGYVQSNFGVAGQYWLIPQLWLRLGIAASSIGVRQDGQKIGDDLDGMQINGAIGYEVWQGRRFAMDLSLSAAAGRYDPDVQDIGTTTAGLALGFNWY
jgi:hypothetical protein